MTFRNILLLLVFAFPFSILGQNVEWSSSKILNEIKKLNTVGSVLYVAAHPDDENTRLLAYLANERHYRTGYLSLTRGDGGQNLIGKEQGEALGLIRTQELLAARRTDGAEQFFTRAKDFGYSKNPEETLTIWDKETILHDVVLTIRRFKPDVIICRFPTTGEGGHGHHTASAMLALEAFDAAADPTKFPEQLKETEVWQAKRVFWNTFNFGGNNTTSSNQLHFDVGGYNPLLGLSYGEIASMSRTMHKSQGFGTAMQRSEIIEYFKLLKGEKYTTDIFDNVVTSWDRIPSAKNVQKLIQELQNDFQVEHPEKSLQKLVAIYQELEKLDATDSYINYWKTQKMKECKRLMLACSGTWLEATSDAISVVPGGKINVTAQAISRHSNDITLLSVNGQSSNKKLTINQAHETKLSFEIAANHAYSDPYWLKKPVINEIYQVAQQELIGTPENQPEDGVVFQLKIAGLEVSYFVPIDYKYTDPVKGEVRRPLEIVPPVTVNLSNKVFVFDKNKLDKTKGKDFFVTIKANKDQINGKIEFKVPNGWSVSYQDAVKISKKGEEQVIRATVTHEEGSQNGKLEAIVHLDGQSYQHSITRIEYDHIPYQFFLTEASAQLIQVDIKKKAGKIGYIQGAGDDVVSSLEQIGYEVTIITEEMLAKDKVWELLDFSSIVMGIRAYNVYPQLHVYHKLLMNYVELGGNLIVQYNTNNRLAPLEEEIGPYPFTITTKRVTDETAEVKITNKKHVVFNEPNRITDADFEGWVQERGIYFVGDMSANYETVLSMKDKGETASKGSLIIGKYGKGNYVYTGLAFFRQLPIGNPGAYRLFVNLLSLPANK